MAAGKTLRNKFDTAYLEMQFDIAAPKERVWQMMVTRTSDWWPKEFSAGGKNTKRIVLEPRIGGRLYEDWGEGNGLTWYSVQSMDAPNMIEFLGRTSKDFGGPAIQIVELRLEAAGQGTRLTLVDTVFGAIDAEALKTDLQGGWTNLFGEAFKGFAESGK